MFHENEEEEPASVMVHIQGGEYDIKNLPGYKRKQLIESGQATVGTFIQADNMPGYKLKAMRDRLAGNLGLKEKKSDAITDISTLEEGSLVKFKKHVTEVKKLNPEKNLVYIDIKGVKKGWIGIEKLKAVNIPPKEEEEEE